MRVSPNAEYADQNNSEYGHFLQSVNVIPTARIRMNILLLPEAAIQKCSSERCSENMQQIYRRIPMPKCDFSKAALQIYWNHTSAWVFSCKLHIFRTPFSKNTPDGLLLYCHITYIKLCLFLWNVCLLHFLRDISLFPDSHIFVWIYSYICIYMVPCCGQ